MNRVYAVARIEFVEGGFARVRRPHPREGRREVVRANEVRGRVYRRDMPIERVLSVKRLSDTSLADGARRLTAFCPSTFSLQHRARQEVASSYPRALLRPHIAKVRSVADPARASDRVPPRPGALRVSRDAPGAGSGAPRWLLPSRFSARPERRLTPPLPLRLPQGRFTPSRRAVVVDKQHSVAMLIPKKNRKEVYKYLFRGASPGDPDALLDRRFSRPSRIPRTPFRAHADPATRPVRHSQRVSSTRRRTSTSPRTPRSRRCPTFRYAPRGPASPAKGCDAKANPKPASARLRCKRATNGSPRWLSATSTPIDRPRTANERLL